MSPNDLMAHAAAPLSKTIRAIDPDQLTAPTPCSEYDVRALVNHLLFWGPSLIGSAAKESVAPPAKSDTDVDLVAGDWQQRLEDQIERTVTAWSDPAAWNGMTVMAVSPDLPATMVGGMVMGELVVHAWDLTQATSQPLDQDDDVLAFLHEQVAMTADQGRQMAVYGAEVTVPDDAPVLDRILGLTGRDPQWAAPAR